MKKITFTNQGNHPTPTTWPTMTPAEQQAYLESQEGKELMHKWRELVPMFAKLVEQIKAAQETPIMRAYDVILQKLGEIIEHPDLQSDDPQVVQLKAIFVEYKDGLNHSPIACLAYDNDAYDRNYYLFNRGNQSRKGAKGGAQPKKPAQQAVFIKGWAEAKEKNPNITSTHYIEQVYQGQEAASTLRRWLNTHEKDEAIKAWQLAKEEDPSITKEAFSEKYHFPYKKKDKLFEFLKDN